MKKTDTQLIKGYIFLGTILFLMFLCFAAFKIQPYKSGAEYRGLKDYSEQDGTALVSITINDFPITIDTYAIGAQYETAWLTTEEETTFTFGPFEACQIWLNGIEVLPGQSISLKIDSISDGDLIPIRILDERTDYDRTVYLRTMPAALPKVSINTYSNEKQMLYPLLCSIGDYIVKYDCFGNVLYYRLSANSADFQSVLTDNGKRYTYLERVASEENDVYNNYRAIVMDEHYNVIDIIDSINVNGNSFSLCKNGFQMLNDEDYLLTAAIPTVLYPDAASEPGELLGDRTIVYYIERRCGGETLWTWESSKIPVNKNKAETINSEYRDFLGFSDLSYNKATGRIALSFDNIKNIIVLDAASGGDISNKIDLKEEKMYQNQRNMNLDGEYKTLHSTTWTQMDESSLYLLVSYADVDIIIGSVYDMRTERLLEDIILSKKYDNIYFDKIIFDAA